MMDNRYALLFIRGERPIKDLKYDLLRHPNIAKSADSGYATFTYGQTPNEVSFYNRMLCDEASYELFSEEELEEFYLVEETTI